MRTRSRLEKPAVNQLALDLAPARPAPALMGTTDPAVVILARLLLEAANLLSAEDDDDAA